MAVLGVTWQNFIWPTLWFSQRKRNPDEVQDVNSRGRGVSQSGGTEDGKSEKLQRTCAAGGKESDGD